MNKATEEVYEPCWIFGYGSLIWRTGFPYLEARAALVAGFKRRFWQGSIDHRGVPGRPGRVVTLIRSAGAICEGRAYRLDTASREDVLRYLDDREVGGYERHALTIRLDNGRRVAGVTWIAWPKNPNFLGPASHRSIAEQVMAAAGPSGPNIEYVLRLHRALQRASHHDPHVRAIASHVENLGAAQKMP